MTETEKKRRNAIVPLVTGLVDGVVGCWINNWNAKWQGNGCCSGASSCQLLLGPRRTDNIRTIGGGSCERGNVLDLTDSDVARGRTTARGRKLGRKQKLRYATGSGPEHLRKRRTARKDGPSRHRR